MFNLNDKYENLSPLVLVLSRKTYYIIDFSIFAIEIEEYALPSLQGFHTRIYNYSNDN